MQNRRHFLKTGISVAAAGLAGAAALTGARRTLAEEAPPETTSVRLGQVPRDLPCAARHRRRSSARRGLRRRPLCAGSARSRSPRAVARGEVDFGQDFSAPIIIPIDAGAPMVMLAGVHPGCFELFARESIRSVVDLKGKNVGLRAARLDDAGYVMLSIIVASVGLDPAKDINWVVLGTGDPKEPSRRRRDRRVPDLSALGAGTARPQLRPRDPQQRARPSMVAVFLLHVDRQRRFCPPQPDRDQARGARHGPGDRHLRRQTRLGRAAPGRSRLYASLRLRAAGLDDVSYRNWREYDPEDAVRFYALRLRELGMIKSSPDTIIATGRGLAVPEGGQERAGDLSLPPKRGLEAEARVLSHQRSPTSLSWVG